MRLRRLICIVMLAVLGLMVPSQVHARIDISRMMRNYRKVQFAMLRARAQARAEERDRRRQLTREGAQRERAQREALLQR